MFKPWLSENIKDLERSTERDYPGKKKRPYQAGNFAEMEHFHEGTYRPFPHPVFPPKVGRCVGRILRPAQAVTWECGGDFPKEFQAEVSGAVGEAIFSMDPFWSEVNEEGDRAVIDPSSGLITIDTEEEACQGSYPPWIIYTVCDDCGCSQGTVWLEDCSGDCCTVPCDPLPVITGAVEPSDSTSEQYTLPNAQGSVIWAISGTDASITQGGLATFGASACGTATVTATDSCCGEFTKEVRVQGNGSSWIGGYVCGATGCPSCTTNCINISGGTQTTWRLCGGGACSCSGAILCDGQSNCDDVVTCVGVGDCNTFSLDTGDGGDCGTETEKWTVNRLIEQFWSCPP